jgi:hypothetical protein
MALRASMQLLKIGYLAVSSYALSFFACTRIGDTNPVFIFDADTSMQ